MRRAALMIFDADGAAVGKQHAGAERLRDDGQIGPLPRRPQITDRGRPAPAVLGGELEIAGALLARPVEIVIARTTGLHRSFDKRVAQRMRLPDTGQGRGPPGPRKLAGPRLLFL